MSKTKYKSLRRFDCVYDGKLYAIGSNQNVTVDTEADAINPPSKKVYLAETQEVLAYLYSIGHDAIALIDNKIEEN